MVLLKKVTILDPSSSFHKKRMDILISGGRIQEIARNISAGSARLIDNKGLFVSAGWCDIGTQVGDPGFEHREELKSVSEAASAGGYTAIACFPNTQPPISAKSQVHYLNQKSANYLIDVYPIGAISEDLKGENIGELLDMQEAGAVAFSDGRNPVQDNGLLLRALEYVKPFNGLIINHAHDKTLDNDGHVHEGRQSVKYGLRGIPEIAEVSMVKRDLDLRSYSESRLLVHLISTKQSAEIVSRAKRESKKIFSSVAAINLFLDENKMEEFDSNYKVLPPLRTKADRTALINAIKSGAIDVISSNHEPLDQEAKAVEFTYAEFGTTGLETAFAIANEALGRMKDRGELLANLLAYNPRRIIGKEVEAFVIGSRANLTLFDVETAWVYKATKSRSTNSPFFNRSLKGKVHGIFNKGKMRIFE